MLLFLYPKIQKGVLKMKDLNYKQLLSLIMHNGLYDFKQKNSSKKTNIVADTDKKGAVALISNKDDLQEGHGIIATSKESVYSFADRNYQFWTPNTYNYLTYTNQYRDMIINNDEKNLQQINAFVVDIDTKLNTGDEVIIACLEYSVGLPTAIIETTKGYQVYFVLEKPIFISNKNNYRSLLVAKKISENIRKSLTADEYLVGVDVTCNHFGYFRMPNASNLRYFNAAALYNTKELIAWSMKRTDELENTLYATKTSIKSKYEALLDNILNYKAEEGQRNNVLFTIALTLYASGISESEALQLCKLSNKQFDNSLSQREVVRCVSSAFSGRYNAPKRAYLTELFEIEDSIFMQMNGNLFMKHAKPREERVYSHLEEWESDLNTWIENNQDLLNIDGYIEITQRELAEALNMPRATLKKLLKQSTMITTYVLGKGRMAKTFIARKIDVAKAKMSNKSNDINTKIINLLAILKQNKNAVQGDLTAFNDDIMMTNTERMKRRC